MPYTGGFPVPPGVHAARGRYDFSVDGGAVGDIDLTSTTQIPKGAVIVGGFVEVVTAPTSGGAGALAIKVESAADIVASAAVSGAPWSTTGFKDVVPDGTGSTAVQTTADRKIQATIATAALTAGKVDVVLFYVEVPD